MSRRTTASPDVLFVVAAGNSGQADDVQADAVQRLGSPNLMIAGATGANGLPTSFTVFGPSIAVCAQGQAPMRPAVDSLPTGHGTRMRTVLNRIRS